MMRILLLVISTMVFGWTPESDLLEMTVDFLNTKTGFFTPFQNDSFAVDEFIFRGPIIGPLTFEDNYAEITPHAPYIGFPDIKPNPTNCWLDPRDNDFGRHVYCILYPTGTHTHMYPSPSGNFPASNNTIKSSGEVWSVMWNEESKVKMLTIGYPINSYRGNSCGFGAVFALICVADPSQQKQLKRGFVAEYLLHEPKEHSPFKDLPSWWKEYCENGIDCSW